MISLTPFYFFSPLSSLLTPLLAIYPSHLISVSVIYLSVHISTPHVNLPLSPAPWWELFDVESEVDIWNVCRMILDLYKHWTGDLHWLIDKEESDKMRLATTSTTRKTVWRRVAEMRLPTTKEEMRRWLQHQQGEGGG